MTRLRRHFRDSRQVMYRCCTSTLRRIMAFLPKKLNRTIVKVRNCVAVFAYRRGVSGAFMPHIGQKLAITYFVVATATAIASVVTETCKAQIDRRIQIDRDICRIYFIGYRTCVRASAKVTSNGPCTRSARGSDCCSQLLIAGSGERTGGAWAGHLPSASRRHESSGEFVLDNFAVIHGPAPCLPVCR